MGEKSSTLWLPNVIKRNGTVYLMSAKHRGDMYHFRAAMALEPTSGKDVVLSDVVLYDVDDSTRELADYVSALALQQKRNVFLASWNWALISSSDKKQLKTEKKGFADVFVGCLLNNQPFLVNDLNATKIQVEVLSESVSTTILANVANFDPEVLRELPSKMALVSDDKRAALEAAFAETKLFESAPKASPAVKNVLMLHRSSGTDKADGAYPELDSGEAIWDIVDIIDSTTDNNRARNSVKPSLNVIFCGAATMPGNPNAEVEDISMVQGETRYSIGRYWLKLADKVKAAAIEGISTRDIEAHFFLWAFKRQYFQLVVGFRSGALDLFTFLGVPTVSITLGGLMGNVRHNLLAAGIFGRVNVEYDTPRHALTAWVVTEKIRDKHGRPVPTETIASPYWEGKALKGVEQRTPFPPRDDAENLRLRRAGGGPARFTAFDKAIVRAGFMLACDYHLSGWQQSLTGRSAPTRRVVRAFDARCLYRKQLGYFTEQAVIDYFTEVYNADQADLAARELPAARKQHQEPDWVVTGLKDESKRHWGGAYWGPSS